MDAVTKVPVPHNEPVRQYPPGSADRAVLESKLKDLAGQHTELTMTIGDPPVMGSGERVSVVEPHNFRRVLGPVRERDRRGCHGGDRRRRFRRPRVAGPLVRRPRRRLLAGRGPAGWPVARHAERRDHPRPVQVGVAGGDRRRVRADRLLAVQRRLRPATARRAARVLGRNLEPHGVPAARGVRAGDHPVQLHVDRGQPADRPGAARQRGRVEAIADPAALGALHRCGCSRPPGCRRA